jgi:ubiquinone/menaquinone biosynthesis C-methylase UbiE
MRRWLHGLLELPAGATLIDLGCGDGEDVRLLARDKPPLGAIIGFDSSKGRDREGTRVFRLDPDSI